MEWQKRRREIKEELIGQTGKQALLVEGADDEFFFRIRNGWFIFSRLDIGFAFSLSLP